MCKHGNLDTLRQALHNRNAPSAKINVNQGMKLTILDFLVTFHATVHRESFKRAAVGQSERNHMSTKKYSQFLCALNPNHWSTNFTAHGVNVALWERKELRQDSVLHD